MSSDLAFAPAPMATGWPTASYAARRRHGENLLGLGGTALVYVVLAAIALWHWTAPSTAPSSRPAPALAVFDVPPAAQDASATAQAITPAQEMPRRTETPPPTPPVPVPLVQLPAPHPAPAEPATPALPRPQGHSDQPADATTPASAAPAAAQPTSGRTAAAERAARANWQGDILAHLRPLLRYPRVAERDGQQGVALVAIGVDRQGIVRSARIVRGSGYPSLDGEALATIRRGSPLPAPTPDIPGDPVSVELPIQFSLRG